MGYAFRLVFKVSEEASFSFDFGGRPGRSSYTNSVGKAVTLRPVGAAKRDIRDGHQQFELASTGYSDQADALAAGQEATVRLLRAAISLDIGIEFSKGEHISRPEGELAEAFKKANLQIIQDRGCLTIFNDDLRTDLIRMSGSVLQIRCISALTESLERAPSSVAPAVDLACELFSHAKFEASSRARFLALMTTLEVLATRERRPDNEVQLIDECISYIESLGLPAMATNKLKSALGGLKKISISDAIQTLAQRYCGDDDAAFCAACYIKRNKLVHSVGDAQLDFDVGRLSKIVLDLITTMGALKS